MKKNIPSVTQVMRSKHSVLSNLTQRLNNHSDLLMLVKKSLPDSLSVHCTGCCLNQTTLILYSNSAAWISQLRFYKPVLLDSIISKASQYAISEIIFRVLVTPYGLMSQNNVNRPNIPSYQTIEEMAESTRHISDKQLRQSFEKLASTLRAQHK